MGLFSTITSLLGAAMMTLAGPAPAITAPPPGAPVGVWPLQPPSVVQGFAPPDEAWSAGHRGVDLAGVVGEPVVASMDGTVTFAGMLAGRGVMVISHGDTRTTYEPLIPDVKRGDLVEAGTRIGALDVTQSHCFPATCLHWGWIRGDEYLDPLQLIGDTPRVRLLPLMPSGGLGGTPS